VSPHEIEMLRLLSGYWFSQTLYVVATLGIADRLAGGPKSAEALADEAGVDRDALYRLLRGLSSAGIFAEVGTHTFALTPLSETLCAARRSSLRPLALLGGHPLHWQAWGELLTSMKTGETAFEIAHGRRFFDALLEDGLVGGRRPAGGPADGLIGGRRPAGGPADLGRTFQAVLSSMASVDQAVVAALDLRGRLQIVDVGGGSGALASRMAAAFPDSRVALFDRKEVLDAAPARPGVELVAGDFFVAVPKDGDAYVLKFTLHDWNDADAIKILENCREAMRPDGRVFVVEVIVPDGPEPSISKTHDVNMLVLSGGRERTLAEYQSLFAAAGLMLVGTIATESDVSVLELARLKSPS